MPDELDARRPELRLERERGEHHVAAVRAAVDDRARAVDLRPRREPRVQRGEIAHRVEPLLDVVEMLEALPVAGRAADVRRRDGVAAPDEVLRQRREAGRVPRPPLRSRGRRARSRRRGTARRPRARRGRRERTRRRSSRSGAAPARRRPVDAPRARRELARLAGVEVVELDLVRLGRRREPEREQRAVGREDGVDDAARQRPRRAGEADRGASSRE